MIATISGRDRRFVPWLLAALLAIVLGGCGPGVGGTGLGEESQLTGFGATSAAVCSSSLAPLLSCNANTASGSASAPSLPTAGDPASLAGTATVGFVDGSQRVRLVLSGNRAELAAACGPLAFGGQFGQVPGQPAGFYGAVESPGTAGPASLQVAALDGKLVASLLGPNGEVLLGPVVLSAAAAETPLAPCGP